MRFSVHLCFDGQCEEAFRTYQQVLGGQLVTLLKYGDSPLAAQTPIEWQNRILHATLNLGVYELLGADLPSTEYGRPQGFFVTLSLSDFAKAQHIFAALAEGGEIKMPFQPTFWAAGFGVLVDRFGVPWEINCGQAESAA